MTPLDRVAQGLLASRDIAPALGVEESVETLENRRRGKQLDPGRGDLDGERQTVQCLTQRHDRIAVVSRHLEVRPHRRRSPGEQPHRVVVENRLGIQVGAGRGNRHGRDRHLLLAGHVYRSAGRGDDLDPGTPSEERSDHRSRLVDLFEVVQHEQRPTRTQVRAESLDLSVAAGRWRSDDVRDDPRNE